LSTIDRPERLTLPPLVSGQRLDRATFHERYKAMPPEIRAELVGGVVFMASPLGNAHGELDRDLGGWLFLYKKSTPGVFSPSNATTILEPGDEVQPDGQLRIREESGGSTRIIDGYVTGPPELVVEIGVTSRAFDLGPKKAAYERAGVREYLFIGIAPDDIHWFALRDGAFVELKTDGDGLYRSETFPGLWLDPIALLSGDLDTLILALDRGLATPEHADFVARLGVGRWGRQP
jgi:Uma2 family endonuclease